MNKINVKDAIELTYQEVIHVVGRGLVFLVKNPYECKTLDHLLDHYVKLNGVLMYCTDIERRAHNKSTYAAGEDFGLRARTLNVAELNAIVVTTSDESHLSDSDKRIKRLLANTVAPESRSVIDAMRKLEDEVRHQYDPDQWGGQFTPFEVFPVKLAKLTKEDIMVKLRSRLNKQYMPTSTRPDPSYNGKPQYLDEFSFGNTHNYSDPVFIDFPLVKYIAGYGTVSLKKAAKETLFAFYGTPSMEFLTNLETEQTLVRTLQGNDRAWYDWDSEEFQGKSIAVNPYVLDECVDVYL